MMSRLVPKLRFEEFSGEWEEEKLIHICQKISQGGTPDTSKEEYWNGSIEWLTPAEMGKRESRFIFSTNRKITEEGLKKCSSDLLPINSVILSTRAPIGHLLINKKKMAINQGCKALISRENIDYNYLYYSLYKNKRELNDLGAGNTFKELSKTTLENFKITFPKDPKEQQKIANTLSSLDSLIEAQNKKVEALKKHKKGLLQQLFPSEGETMPKLRFDGFSGDWEEKKVNDFFTTFSGGTPTSSNKDYYGGNIPFVRSAEINKTKTELFLTEKGLDNSSAKYVNKGDVLYALYGANSGDVAISKIKGTINQAILCLHSNKANHEFLYFYLLKEKKEIINKYIQGGQGNLSGDIVKSITLFFPTLKEQQKIANTLSSLDSLIEAQNKKVEALKKHKKGLMQQMFVSSEVGV